MNIKNISALVVLVIIGGFFSLFAIILRTNETHDLSCLGCNVIIVGFDALQASHVSHLGYFRDTTPTLDQLAAQGVSFSKHYTVAPWTVPSFMSLFTALYPSEHKVVNKFSTFTRDVQEISNLKKLSPEVLTIAEAFKESGYITGGFTGDAGVNSIFGYDSGFNIYTDEQVFGSMSRSAEHALQWLDNNKGKKFFMFFHGYDAHGQFSELEENYISRYASKGYDGRFKITPEEQKNLREEGLERGELSLTKEEVSAWNAWYDGKIRDADDRLGLFLSELENRDILNNTLIIVYSDHGTEIYEHKRFDHGYSLYNELIRVPLIIKWPNKNIGKIISTQVRSIDVLPTIFDIVGIPKNELWQKQIRGESFLPVISGKDKNNRPVFSETNYRAYTYKRSLITPEEWKLIVTMENGEVELYNLKKDPKEITNLAKNDIGRVHAMRELLYKYMENTGQNLNGPWATACLPVYNGQCSN
ncbi:MAG: sulfatase [Parcubacteria group bacterium]|nr:sulfatase [Parcubacteria group bacterium]